MNTDLAYFLAILAPFALFFNQIKQFATQCLQCFVRIERISAYKTEILDEILGPSRFYFLGPKALRAASVYKLDKSEWEEVFSEEYSRIFVLYKKYIPMLLLKTDYNDATVIFFNLTFDFAKIIDNVQKKIESQSKLERRFRYTLYVAQNNDANKPSGDGSTGGSFSLSLEQPAIFHTFVLNEIPRYIKLLNEKNSNISLSQPPDAKQDYYWSQEAVQLKQDMQFWYRSKKWYVERGIPWRRGAMLYGLPGTGKSEMVFRAASDLDIPICVINVAGMNNADFKGIMEAMSHCVVLIEDIDAVFNGRDNVMQKDINTKQLLTFDFFINTISGPYSHTNYLVITTNDLDKLDAALIRDGRIDKKIEVGHLDEAGKEFVANNVLLGYNEDIAEMCEVNVEPVTVAEFTGKCIRRAQDIYWGKLNNVNADKEILVEA